MKNHILAIDLFRWKNIMYSISQDVTTSYQFFQLCRFTAWIFVSIILVQSGLSLATIGTFEYTIFLVGLASFIWNMGFKNALLSYYPKQKSTKGLFFNSFLIQLGFGIVFGIGLMYYLSWQFVPELSEMRMVIGAIVLLMGVSTLPEFYHLLNQQAAKLWKYGIVIYGLQVLLLGISAFFIGYFTYLIWAYFLWILSKSLYFIILLIKRNDFHFCSNQLYSILGFSLPFVFYIIISYGMEYVDGIIVKSLFPIDAFSVFKYGARELPLASILVGAMVSATIPKFISASGNNFFYLKRRIKHLIYILYPLSMVLIFLSPWIFPTIYDHDYQESAWIFNIYLLILISRILVPQIFFIVQHKINVLTWIGIIEILVNLSLSLLLAPYLGLKGIALGTLLAYIFQKFILVFYASKKMGISLDQYVPLKEYLVFSAILILSFLLVLYYHT